MKDITLKMTSSQRMNGDDENIMEFITEGRLFEKNGATYVIYDESEVLGADGCKTTLKITDDSFRMKRIGQSGFGADMFFKEGARFNSIYQTPFGSMGIEILTRTVKNALDEECTGMIDIEYDISMEGMSESKNKLRIDII